MSWEESRTRWTLLLAQAGIKKLGGVLEDAGDYWKPKGEGWKRVGEFWGERGEDIKGFLGVSEDYWLNTTKDMLVGFGVPEKEADRVAKTLGKMVPDIPGIKQMLLMMYPMMFAVTILPKAFGSVSDVIDKQFRRDLLPLVGNFSDLLVTNWRYEDEELFQKLAPEIGLSPEWAAQITGATQFWPEVSMFQELFRRGVLSEDELHDWFSRSGVKDGRIEEQLNETTWNVPPLNVVLEMYRRGNLDEKVILPYMQKVGFKDKDAEFVLQSAKRLFDVPNLFELHRRGILQDRDYVQQLEKLGYEDNDRRLLEQLEYRLPEMEQLTRMYFRKVINKQGYQDGLHKLGYKREDADKLEKTAWVLPGPADLMRFGLREVFTPEIARRFGQFEQYPQGLTPWANKIGMSEEIAKMYWAAHWDLPSVGQMFDMLHRRIITKPDMLLGLRAQDVMPYWQEKLVGLSYRLIPRRTLPRMVKQELITHEGLVDRFRKLGYNPQDSVLMADSAILQAQEAERELSRGDIVRGMSYGWYDESKARALLADIRYSNGAIDFSIKDGLRRKALEDARDGAEQVTTEAKRASDAIGKEVVRSYGEGMVTKEDARNKLLAVGVDRNVIDYKLLLQELIDSRQFKDFAGDQVHKLFTAGLRNTTEAINMLDRFGYTATEANRIVARWTIEYNVKNELDTVRDRLPTKAELDKWVKLGTLSVDDYVDYMRKHGYSDDVVSLYLQELAIELQG